MKKEKNKKSKKVIAIYLILRILVIASCVGQMLLKNWFNAALCIFTLILFSLPTLVFDKFKMELPSKLEITIYLFIYASVVLGGIGGYYERIPMWDTILHTLNGFLCAGIGFSLVDMLNQNSKSISLSPIYVAIVAFCFSMTIGVLWEFAEFSCDMILKTDHQRDRIVYNISSYDLDNEKGNPPVKLNEIEKTDIYLNGGEKVTIKNGYMDIGLIDTMKDLIVNFIGAFVFCIFGFFNIKYRDKYKSANEFIPRKKYNSN